MTGRTDRRRSSSKRCLDCRYILDGMQSQVCPECGRPFDPEDPATFTRRQNQEARSAPTRRAVAIVVLYSSCLGLCWLLSTGLVSGYPLEHRIRFVLWMACGPIAYVAPFRVATLTFAACWTAWLTIACRTRVNRIPLLLHFCMGLLWCLSGCPATAVDC